MLKDNVLYAGLHASGCTTYWHVLEIAALCAVGPSAAFGLAFSGRGIPRSRFESFCFFMCKRKQAEPKDVEPQEDVLTKGKQKTTVKGARDERMKAFRSNLAGPIANLNPLDKHVAIDQLLYGQCKALYACQSLPGAQSGVSIVQWWGATGAVSYPHLIAGVRALLSIPASNAGLDRVFGGFKSHLTPQKLRSHGQPMYLKVNCSALGMRAYMAEEDLQQEHKDSGSEAASDGDCEQALSQSECDDEVEVDHEGIVSDGEGSCAICCSAFHITTSCPFCYAGFWADAAESQKMRQAIFRGTGVEFASGAVEVRVVPSDGDCMFAALGLELQARGVLAFDGVTDDLGQKVRASFFGIGG